MKLYIYLFNTGNSNDLAKLANQNQVQQMQSAVQLLTQGVLSRHNTLRPQSIQSTWSNPNIKQYPGMYSYRLIYY